MKSAIGTSLEYDEKYYVDNNQSEDRIANHFFSDILKRYIKSGEIFEYGCGSGFFIQKFDAKKYVKKAHDISAHAMKVTSKNNPGIELVRTPEKDIKDNTLDGVAALHVLEHIANPSITLELFHKKLKHNGTLFFTVPNMKSVGRKIKKDEWFGYRDKTHISLLSPDEWLKRTRNAGFEIMKVGSDGMWDVPYLKYVPLVLQKLFFYPTSGVQVILKRTFMPISTGENLIIVARKK